MYVLLLLVLSFLLGCAGHSEEPPLDVTILTAGEGDNMAARGGSTTPDKMKTKGWSQSGKMFTGNTVKFVRLQADFASVGEYTVQFAVTPAVNGQFATALITWSVEGNSIQRRVSVANGVSVTGLGQGVSVLVSDETGSIISSGSEYEVTITCTPGARPSVEKPPTRMLLFSGGSPETSIGPATTIGPFSLKDDPGIISVYVAVSSNSHAPIVDQEFWVIENIGGNLVRRYSPNFSNGGFVPISPGADEIEFRNNSAADTLSISVDFGIDG